MDLSIDDGRPIFAMDGVNDSRIRIRIYLEFGRLGEPPRGSNPDGTNAKK